MAKRLLAAACAFGIVLGGTAAYRTHNGTAQTGSAAVADAINHIRLCSLCRRYRRAASAEGQQDRVRHRQWRGRSGNGFLPGCLFKVTGEDIKTVSATIDKGAVYRTKTVKDTSDDRDEWVRSMHQGTNPELDGADWIMVWGSDEMHMYADLCWELDNGFTDAYDPDTSYGLWLPSQPLATDDDLQDSRHKAVDGFEGAKLTVTITFTDGSEQTRSMTLHTGKLGVEYKDDTSGPSLTGEVLTDEQAAAEGYIYGVYADIE